MIEVALTIDDLPKHGKVVDPYDFTSIITMILDAAGSYALPPMCGFMNGGLLEGFPEGEIILKKWIEAGNFLGNHTYSHYNLPEVSSEEYINDIIKNEPIIARFQQRTPKYFRYPFLMEGETEEKFSLIKTFLEKSGYQIIPVTMDFFDFSWNSAVNTCIKTNNWQALEKLESLYIEEALINLRAAVAIADKLFNKKVKHILLLHAGIATGLFLNNTIAAFNQEGCKFISLEEALSDEIYKTYPKLITSDAPSFLVRWAKLHKLEIIWPRVEFQKILETIVTS